MNFFRYTKKTCAMVCLAVAGSQLSDNLAALAEQAIAVQMLFDVAFRHEFQEYQRLMADTPESCRDLLRPIMPERMVVREFDLATSVTLIVGSEEGMTLRVFPVNAHFAVRHSVTVERLSRMRITVEQRPQATSTTSDVEDRNANNE